MNKPDLNNAIGRIHDIQQIVGTYDRTGQRYLRQAIEAVRQNNVLESHFPVRLFNGSVMNINVREEVGALIFEYKAYEIGLTKFVVNFLEPGDVFFDVGAHYGYFSVVASDLVGPTGKVYSFEPTPTVADHLRSNILHRGNAEVHQTAVGDKDGEIEFNDYGPDFSAFNSAFAARVTDQVLAAAQRVKVPVSRLDTFCANRNVVPKLIKIDTESSEMLVLKGMGRLLEKVEAIIVELGDFEALNSAGVPRSSEILEYLRALGYKLFMPSVNGLIDHEISGESYSYCNIVCIKDSAEYHKIVSRSSSLASGASRAEGGRVMNNPYKSLPAHAFWRRAVSNVASFEIDPVTHVPFTIKIADKVATAGSCFAQHIAKSLSKSGFNYYVAETAPRGMDQEEAARNNYGTFSARYGNVYTVRQLVQLFDRAFGVFSPSLQSWQTPSGRFVDPYRPQITTDGFETENDLLFDREVHLRAVREMFSNLDVFVFTLGLTEAWRHKNDGSIVSVAPGVVGGEWDPAEYEFVNFDVDEIRSDLNEAIERIRGINPRSRIILTVSPVPLVATYENRHVLSSTVYSKSVLRVAAETASRNWGDVVYFPSYEIITNSGGRYFDSDLRSVNEKGVRHVMRMFYRHIAPSRDDAQGRHQTIDFRRSLSQGAAVICDEEALDAEA